MKKQVKRKCDHYCHDQVACETCWKVNCPIVMDLRALQQMREVEAKLR